MKVRRFFETSANDYRLKQRRIPQELDPQLHRCENIIIRNPIVHHRVHNSLMTYHGQHETNVLTLISLRCNMKMNQQDAQILVIRLHFSLDALHVSDSLVHLQEQYYLYI
jgi:hypothetical protein